VPPKVDAVDLLGVFPREAYRRHLIRRRRVRSTITARIVAALLFSKPNTRTAFGHATRLLSSNAEVAAASR
jgi:hypothetical protein